MGITEISEVIGKNLLGYDMTVFIVAAVNAVMLVFAWRYANLLHSKLHLTVFVPEKTGPKVAEVRAKDIHEGDIVELRKKAGRMYELFANITSIFPLLGILGTVISLLPMVSMMADVSANFFAALTSTFWGLVFAIIYKVLDGFIAARMEDNEKNVALFLERNKGAQ